MTDEACAPLACHDCGLPYGGEHWVEAVVANHIWNQYLSPTHNGGGILCVNCMAKRAVMAGLSNIHVRLTAGPFVTGKSTAAIREIASPLSAIAILRRSPETRS